MNDTSSFRIGPPEKERAPGSGCRAKVTLLFYGPPNKHSCGAWILDLKINEGLS